MSEQSKTTLSPGAAQIVEKLHARAEAALAPLAREMRLMGWPTAYQSILWETVATVALVKAREAEHGKQS